MRALMWNPYRTGGWVVAKDDSLRRIFGPPELVANMLKKRYAFVQHSVFVQLGLPLPGRRSPDDPPKSRKKTKR